MARPSRMICASQDLAEGGRGLRFQLQQGKEALPAFAIRYRGGVYAYVNRCAHLGVELDWIEGEFFDLSGLYLICSTHGALYAPDTGRCLGGPCGGRGLDPLPVEEREGQVFIAMKEGQRS